LQKPERSSDELTQKDRREIRIQNTFKLKPFSGFNHYCVYPKIQSLKRDSLYAGHKIIIFR